MTDEISQFNQHAHHHLTSPLNFELNTSYQRKLDGASFTPCSATANSLQMRNPFYSLRGGAASVVFCLCTSGAAAFQTIPVQRTFLPLHEFGKGSSAYHTVRPELHRPQVSPSLYSTSKKDANVQLTTNVKDGTSTEIVPSTWNQALHRFFLGDIGPPLVVLTISGFIYTRLQLPQTISITDATITFTAVLFWWIQEYFFHKVLLHSPFDWIGKSIHQNHHQKNYFHVSIDPPELLLGWLFAAHFMLKSVLPWHLCLSSTIGYAIAGLCYEWSHYIVHTRVKAPTVIHDNFFVGSVSSALARLFCQMRDNHIRHHRVDSSYWYAFSVPCMDDLFGTNPDIKELKR